MAWGLGDLGLQHKLMILFTNFNNVPRIDASNFLDI